MPQTSSDPTQPVRLTRSVRLPSGHYIHRSALPDSHPESWPSKVKELTGSEIPEGWRDRLRILPPTTR